MTKILKIARSAVAGLVLMSGFTASGAGLVHRWSFTETNGPVVDSVGAANGSVIVQSSSNSVRTNGVIQLGGGTSGTADYIQLPANLLDGVSNVTIETWATPRGYQIWSRLFDFGLGNGTQVGSLYLSLCRADGTLNQQRFKFGSTIWSIDTSVATTAGQQYHYVVTWSATGGTNGGGRAQWFRNGVLATSLDTGSSTVSNVNDTVLWLGRSQVGGDNIANVDYNEFRIYDAVLGQAQINANFTNGPDTIVLLPPVAVDDSVTLNPGAMALVSILQNDQGQSSALDPATIVIVTPPASGTAQIKPGGKVLYTHTSGSSPDQFTYRVSDLAGLTSAVATVSITVSPALRLPNTTLAISNTPPPVAYRVVDAFPGVVFTNPVALRSPPNNSNVVFVVERTGVISYASNINSANPTRHTFLDLRAQTIADTNNPQGEIGMLGLEFHPNFASNGYFYVFYMSPTNVGALDRLSRFEANPATLAQVNTNTQQRILEFLDAPNGYNNHNGGDLHFNPVDGYLYISMGDEGAQYNASLNAQRLDRDFYAGILRIDVDRKPGNVEPTPHPSILTNTNGLPFYSIPADNPFLGFTTLHGAPLDTNKLRGEFYAIGLRHVWRFSIDPANGEVWFGNVGQVRYEEVGILKKGGNYGWPYYEATHLTVPMYGTMTGLSNPPPGFVREPVMYEYPHAGVAGPETPEFRGQDVNGSLVYHGSRMPALSNAYLFGDFDGGGNIWALRRISTNAVTVERIAGQTGISAFGRDPGNGDPLLANYLQNKIQRLVRSDVPSAFPTNLSETGIFADISTLTPNPGIVSYEPNVSFWSDHAIKSRWFTISDLTNTLGFTEEGGWTLPTGTKWIKHFDMEMTRGNPATKQRIETRVLVKATNGVFGVSYKWNAAQDDAVLVGDSGDLFQLTITNNGVPVQQDYEIPARSTCQSCHTPVGGFALTFNTREMNRIAGMNGFNGNQISTLSSAGYFSSPVANPHAYPAFAAATDTNASLEYRVRSYLAVNCSQCHQPLGGGQGIWDARPFLTLAQTGLINGTPITGDGGNPANKLIVPGDTNHSILLMRLENNNGFARMPPLATHELDMASIQLVQNWITLELPGHLTYAQWIALYPSLTGPATDPGADPDGDDANNYFEYLTATAPDNSASEWTLSLTVAGGQAQVSYPRVPNLGVVIETSDDLVNWTQWNVTGNQPFFAASAGTNVLSGPISSVPPNQFFRARLIEP